MKRTIASVNRINIFYRDTGSDRQTILCLHGKWGRGETWTEFINRYRDKYRIIAPDQRGHGLSEKPIARYASQDLAADAYELIRQLNCLPVIIVGHSMGGRIAAHLAALYPQAVKALAILDVTAEGHPSLSQRPPDEIPADDQLTTDWPTPYPTLDEAISDLSKRFPRETNVKYFMQSLVETVQGYDFLFSRKAMAALGEYSQDWFSILPRIECPTLLVRATDSWCFCKEAANRMIPLIKDVTYFEVSGSDHMVYVDNPDEFYPQWGQFLNRVT